MATVTGYTAARMKQIEDETVVDGDVVGDNLVLRTRAGVEIAAGNVRGPQGQPGPTGSITASPAGGALNGNYPNPGLAPAVVQSGNVHGELKDGQTTMATMRSLGTGATQAAAGNHNHGDTGWVTITPAAIGEAPFNTRLPVYLEYRKFGPWVQVRFRKDSLGAVDRSGNTAGNFPNTLIFPTATIPEAIRSSRTIEGAARFNDSPQGVLLTHDGAVLWVGGFPRSYAAGSQMLGTFSYMAG